MPNTVNTTSSKPPKHYVGLGASAGGLEAIQAFFKQMPKESGLAFIIIQHLSPDYKSLMSELVAKITEIPVHVAQDNMLVQADHIYLIPPKKNLKIFHGHLILTDQVRTSSVINLPIDMFFTSLAEDQTDRAIGIILSGTGSDGTRGCRSIKELGGMVMVQDENSAKFDGMPRSVIANGLPDFVLVVEDMPSQLMSYIKHPTTRNEHKLPIQAEKSGLAKIYSLLREKSKVDFTFYKPSTIVRRIERRMTVTQVDSLENYVHYLVEHPIEQNTLFRELLIGVTSFFRDTEVFDALTENWLRLALQKNQGGDFRIWVAGCSTGEEAYSYAILCAELLQQIDIKPEIKIFATDIDVDAINKAGNGVYPESIAADIPNEYLAKYFIHRGDSYQVTRQIREMVVFAKHNIIKDPPFTNISLVSCRNMLIYLQPVLQQKVFNSFNFSLQKDGLLVLGSSESVGEASSFFEVVHNKYKIFTSMGNRKALISLGEYETPENVAFNFPRRARSADDHFGMEEGAILAAFVNGVVKDYIPCALIVDEEMHLLHVTGEAGRYMQPFSGKVSTEIVKNIHKDLMIPVSTGLTKVFKTNLELGFSNVKLQLNANSSIKVDIRIKPLPVKRGKPQLAAVVISDLNQPAKLTDTSELNYDIGIETEQRIVDLEQELQFTRENLQATIEELETSNEELQATNEELLASNEELQSTNEELQSVNEELFTVNSEFQGKIQELTELNNDLDNFMNNAGVIALFLDENMDIRKFTRNASLIFNVRLNDQGRPFKELKDHLPTIDLHQLTLEVNEDHKSIKIEVQADDGNWYYLQILPYMITNNIQSGVVILLNEINTLKAAQEELNTEYTRQKLIHEKLAIGTWDWDIQSNRLIWSEETIKMFGKELKAFHGRFDEFMQCVHPDDKALVEQNFNACLQEIAPYHTQHRILLPAGEVRWVEKIGKVITDNQGNPKRMIGIVRDISEQMAL